MLSCACMMSPLVFIALASKFPLHRYITTTKWKIDQFATSEEQHKGQCIIMQMTPWMHFWLSHVKLHDNHIESTHWCKPTEYPYQEQHFGEIHSSLNVSIPRGKKNTDVKLRINHVSDLLLSSSASSSCLCVVMTLYPGTLLAPSAENHITHPISLLYALF